LHRGNVLDSWISAKVIKKVPELQKQKNSQGHDVIQKAREEYGRYFGICGSYHHLKACLCKYCSSYPGAKACSVPGEPVVRGEDK
jgi:hypothetical protein